MRQVGLALCLALAYGCSVPHPNTPPPIPPRISPSHGWGSGLAPAEPTGFASSSSEVECLSQLHEKWQGFEAASIETLPTRAWVAQALAKTRSQEAEVEAEVQRLIREQGADVALQYARNLRNSEPITRSDEEVARLNGFRQAMSTLQYPKTLVTLQGAFSQFLSDFDAVPSKKDLDLAHDSDRYARSARIVNAALKDACLSFGLQVWQVPEDGIDISADRMSWLEYKKLINDERDRIVSQASLPASDFGPSPTDPIP
jgi:hypothetical protein